MKLVCTHKCQVLGRSIYPGAVVDIPEALIKSDVVRSSFDTPEAVEKEQKVAEIMDGDMSPAEYRRRLDEFGVAYAPKATKTELKKLYAAQVAGK